MPSREWQLRIHDILASATEILERTVGMTFEDFAADRTIVKAVLYDFFIIGEATRNVPSAIQARYPQIPWRLMGDMRNVMAHEYFQVNLQIVWDGIQNELPPLVLQLQDLQKREARGGE